MRRHIKTFLGYLLIITIVFSDLPIVARATGEDTQNEENTVSSEDAVIDSSAETDEPDVTVIDELVEKREANIKHFRMSDGSIKAAVYPKDVHYKDENGDFVNIDNSFAEDNDGTDDVIANQENEFQVKFMKKSNKNKLYTLNKGKDKITVSIEGVNKVKAQTIDSSAPLKTGNNDFKVSNISSQMLYRNIFENVDLEYAIVSKELKENIILKDEVDFQSIIYNYKIGNHHEVVAEDDKNLKIVDKDSNEVVLCISAPIMWDANGNSYDNLTLQIVEEKNTSVKVKLSWKLEKDMVYPITIDPVLSFSTNRLEIQDTYIVKSASTTNYNYNDHIKLRNDGYALLEFPTPDLSSGDKIIHAELILAPYMFLDDATSEYSNTNSYDPALYITAHKILRAWDETTVTYQSAGTDSGFFDSTVYSYRILDNDNDFYTWDITRLASEWTEGGVANHGVLLKFDKSPSNGSIANAFFCSTNGRYNPVEYYPQILYQYINTTGIEDYYSYHTQDLGYAGQAYTNDLTGNLTIINPILQTGGSLMPITISLVYNTNNINESATPYGRGWKLNWSQKIDWSVKSNYDNTQYVKYTDCDGTEHFFTVDNTTGIWADEINPDRKVYYIESTGDYKMTDNSGTNMYFTRNGSLNEWYLCKIEDIYGNYIQLTLNSSDLNRVDKISSSTGNVVDFIYNEYGFLVSIQYYDEDQTKNITIGYNNHVVTPNNCISNVYYPDGTYVQYHYYDTTCYISKVVDIGGQSIGYNYKWTTPLRVNYIVEYSSDSQLGAVMTMDYQATSTVFHDVTNNRKYLYTFASNGTLECVVDITANDGNGYGQYYEYNNGNTTATTGTGNLTFMSKTQKSTVNILKNHSFESAGEHNFIAWDETTGKASGTYSTEKSHIGARSYKITRPAESNCSRAIGYYYIYLEGGKTYTLSAYVHTSGMTSLGSGASLMFIDDEKIYESEYITETADKWQRLSLSFTARKSEYVNICMNLSGATGSVYFDNIQLEVGDMSDYNLLENAGFEEDNSSSPRGWSPSTYIGSISETHKASGNRAVHISGSVTKHFHYMQEIVVPNGKTGDTYVASAFAKAASVPAEGWKFTILVRFIKNGSTVNEQNILFNSYTTEWQKVAGAVKATGDYDTIQFWLLYYGNCNTVFFDNAQLIKDTFGTTYTYDSNGNLISTVDFQGKEEYTFKYDGNNQLIKQNNLSGSKFLYTYNLAKPQQLDFVSSGGVTTSYTYDGFGNAIAVDTTGGALVSDKYYYIQNLHYNKYLDTDNFGTADGTTIKYWDLGKNSAQRWKLIENSDGTYSLSPECAPNSLLSVEPTSLYNTAKVALYSVGAVPYQKFNVTKIYGNIYRLDVATTGYSLDGVESGCYVYESHTQDYQQYAFIFAEGNETADNPSITSSATYSANGEYMTSMTDSRGNTTSYEYNKNRGYLTSETNPKDVKTTYAYSSSELLDSVNVANSTVTYGYDTAKRLSSITSPSGTVYGFTYDSFGSNMAIKIGLRNLSNYVYDNAKGLLDYTLYGNGTLVDYSYDALGRQTETIINQALRYTKLYDGASRLLQVEDLLLGKKIKYEYDILDRAVSEKLINTTENKVYAQLGIHYDDAKNRVAGYDVNINGISNATDFVYGENKVAPDIITSIKHNDTNSLFYGYDSLNRLKTRTVPTTAPFVTEYGYLKGVTADTTTTLVKTVKNGNDILEYTYDSLENITEIKKNGTVVESYTYDNLNQLKTVTRGSDTYEYIYDNGGNILSVKRNGEVIKTYTYGDSEWKDLLTAYNGETITYDTIGNPLTYRAGMNFTWTDGRKLSTITKGTDSISYTYDANGLRNSKTVNGTTTAYYWLNGMLQGQKTGEEYIFFLYDENGTAYGFIIQNGTETSYYYYEFNLQGDIIGIIDSNGNKVVEYTYNEWGEILGITGTLADSIGQKNPFRYRGYYYDAETGFYYVSSRYYDPEIGRFLNADAAIGQIGNVQSHNMYAYAFNNPVMYSDPDGNWPKLSTILTGVAVAAVVVAVGALCVATGGLASVAIAGGGSMLMATATTTTALGVAGVAAKVAVASAGAATVSKAVELSSSRRKSGNHTVYKLVDGSGNAQYVGRTTNLPAREKAHKANPNRAGLDLQIIKDGLSYEAARGVEQTYMLYYHTINTSNEMNNQINGISPNNKKIGVYITAAKGALGYTWNQVSNEILYWSGQ